MNYTSTGLFIISLLIALVIVIVLPVLVIWFIIKPKIKPTKID